MGSIIEASNISKYVRLRKILLLLLLLSLPLGCCGCLNLLDVLQASNLPPALDFSLNLFESTVSVENKTNETLYITPISTTYGYPQVISQYDSIRQRDFPLSPNDTKTLTYDSADFPLAGIVVCRENRECKLLLSARLETYQLTSFESLSEPDSSWLSAVESYPEKSFYMIYMAIFSIVPIILVLGWLYFGWLEKRKRE